MEKPEAVEEAEKNAKSKETVTPSTDKSKQLTVKASSKSRRSKEEKEGDVTSGVAVDKEDDKSDSVQKRERDSLEENSESLKDFMLAYAVPSDQDLVQDWQAFKSHLVERVYEETGVN